MSLNSISQFSIDDETLTYAYKDDESSDEESDDINAKPTTSLEECGKIFIDMNDIPSYYGTRKMTKTVLLYLKCVPLYTNLEPILAK